MCVPPRQVHAIVSKLMSEELLPGSHDQVGACKRSPARCPE